MRYALAVVMLAACDDNRQTPIEIVDAAVVHDAVNCFMPDTPASTACSAIDQFGCGTDTGLRCAYVRVAGRDVSGITMCLADGTVAEGGACTWQERPRPSAECPSILIDDCAAGLYCADGMCRRLCFVPEPDCANGTCMPDPTLHRDGGVGVCQL